MADIDLRRKVDFLISQFSSGKNYQNDIQTIKKWMKKMQQAGYDNDDLQFEIEINANYLKLKRLENLLSLAKTSLQQTNAEVDDWRSSYNLASNQKIDKYNRCIGLTLRPKFENYFTSILFNHSMTLRLNSGITIEFNDNDGIGTVSVTVYNKIKEKLGSIDFRPLSMKWQDINLDCPVCYVWYQLAQLDSTKISLNVYENVFELDQMLNYSNSLKTLEFEGQLSSLDYFMSNGINYEWITGAKIDLKTKCFIQNYSSIISCVVATEKSLIKKLSSKNNSKDYLNAGLVALMTVQELNRDTIVKRIRNYTLSKNVSLSVGVPSTKGIYQDNILPKLPNFSYYENIVVYGANLVVVSESAYDYTVGNMISTIEMTMSDKSYGMNPTDNFSISSGDMSELPFTMTVSDEQGTKTTMGQILVSYKITSLKGEGMAVIDGNLTESKYGWLAFLNGQRSSSGTAYGIGIVSEKDKKLCVVGNATVVRQIQFKIFINDVLDVSTGLNKANASYIFAGQNKTIDLSMKMTSSIDNGIKNVYYLSNLVDLDVKDVKVYINPIVGVPFIAPLTTNSDYSRTVPGLFDVYDLSLNSIMSRDGLGACVNDYPFYKYLASLYIYSPGNEKLFKQETVPKIFNGISDAVSSIGEGTFSSPNATFNLEMNTVELEKPVKIDTPIGPGVQVWHWNPITHESKATLTLNGDVHIDNKTSSDVFKLLDLKLLNVSELVFPEGFSNTVDVVDLFSKINNELQLLLQCNYVILRWLTDLTDYVDQLEKQIQKIMDVLQKLTSRENVSWLKILGGILEFIGEVISTFAPFVGTIFMAVGAFTNALGDLQNNDILNFLTDLFTGIFIVGIGIWNYSNISTYLRNKYANIRKIDDNGSLFSEGGGTVSTYIGDNESILVDFDNSETPYDFSAGWPFDNFDSNQFMSPLNIYVDTQYHTSDARNRMTRRIAQSKNAIKWMLRGSEKVTKIISTVNRSCYINEIDVLIMYVFEATYDAATPLNFTVGNRRWWRINGDKWEKVDDDKLLTSSELDTLKLTMDEVINYIQYDTEYSALFKDGSYGLGLISFDEDFQRMKLLVAWWTRHNSTIPHYLRNPLKILKVVSKNNLKNNDLIVSSAYYANAKKLVATDIPQWLRK